ncbi:MAG: hypothetical protein Q7J73_02350 [Dehalococcoidales bacterium]|nr:hypothetical protein [Dehalococcoidales bacterium]
MATTEIGLAPILVEEANLLGRQLFGRNARKGIALTNRLLDICTRVQGKDMLLIHNPGGWGRAPLEELLPWERSIVDGVVTTVGSTGYNWLLVQHFRNSNSIWARMRDMKEEANFLFKGNSRKVAEMAAEVEFIARRFNNLKILLIGASQGAAFSNAVMRQIGELGQVYSIELGIFFPHMSRRVITERTLSIDDNGQIPDPVSHGKLLVSFKAYIGAPYRWIKYRLHGQPKKLTYCVNAPGHDYNWTYPMVHERIEDFLKINFGTKGKPEESLL